MSETKNVVINTHILPGCYCTKLVPEIEKKNYSHKLPGYFVANVLDRLSVN